MNPKSQHGGPRPGSGRKRKDVKHLTFSGSMHPAHLARMRHLQQGQPLGRFLVQKLGLDDSDVEGIETPSPRSKPMDLWGLAPENEHEL